MDAASCSSLSLRLGEPLAATASEAGAWLLIEQPGAWGRKALTQSQLDPGVGAELERRAKALGVKALLVKRHGRADASTGRRTVMLGRGDHGAAWLEAAAVEDDAGLLTIDLEGLAAGERGHGAPVDGAVYLVCTNGRRDACCASLGRPVAAALAAARPDRVWECSHVGGHRFAANVVCLPDGLVYGRVTPGDAERIAASYEEGRIVLERYRGRSSLPPAAQAADLFVRERERIDGVASLALQELRSDGDEAEAVLGLDGSRFRVRVRREDGAPARITSCADEKLETPAVWSLVELSRCAEA